jgi:hypothetical protein
MLRVFLQRALPVRGFSIRILLFGLIELDLPTPVSNPPFWGTHLHSWVAYPHQKAIAQSNNSFWGFPNFLLPNLLKVKNVAGDHLAMENLEKVNAGKKHEKRDIVLDRMIIS